MDVTYTCKLVKKYMLNKQGEFDIFFSSATYISPFSFWGIFSESPCLPAYCRVCMLQSPILRAAGVSSAYLQYVLMSNWRWHLSIRSHRSPAGAPCRVTSNYQRHARNENYATYGNEMHNTECSPPRFHAAHAVVSLKL